MRILQVVSSLQLGGLERLVVDLSTELNRCQDESIVCCLEEGGPLGMEAREAGVTVLEMGHRGGLDLRLVPRLASLMRRVRVDVVHTHNPGPLTYGTPAARLAGVATVLNTRHGRERRKNASWLWALNHAVVAVSEDAKRRLLAVNRIRAEKVHVIRNGIDVHAFRPSGNGRSRWPQEWTKTGPVIGTVGRMAVEKDHATLLVAFAEVLRTQPEAVLALVGDGGSRPDLERLATELGVAGRVAFLGVRRDIAACLEMMDLFVLPSATEGLSLTLLEAMAAGKPVVATRVGGNAEVIRDGESGLLVPARDPEALAEAIGRALADPAFARRLGTASRKRVQEEFTLARMVAAYRRLYENLGGH